jgi:nucleotide-binding universal stress UspA family protein
MKPERILLPLDVRECPLDVFPFVEGLARRPEVTLILLQVINTNIAVDNRIHKDLALEACWYLERLAQQYVHPITATLLHARIGDPAEQILQEAEAEEVDLIILPVCEPSFWCRLVSVWKPGNCRLVPLLAERIIRDSACGVFVASTRARFDCEKAWGWEIRKSSLTLDGSRTPPQGRTHEFIHS